MSEDHRYILAGHFLVNGDRVPLEGILQVDKDEIVSGRAGRFDIAGAIEEEHTRSYLRFYLLTADSIQNRQFELQRISFGDGYQGGYCGRSAPSPKVRGGSTDDTSGTGYLLKQFPLERGEYAELDLSWEHL